MCDFSGSWDMNDITKAVSVTEVRGANLETQNEETICRTPDT